MILRHLILTVFGLTLSATAFAAPSVNNWETLYCESTQFIGLKIINYPNRAKLTCDEVQPTLDAAFKKIQDISPYPMSGPLLMVYNKSLTSGGAYEMLLTTMDVSLATIDKLEIAVPMLYHEMGHKLYYEFASRREPALIYMAPVIAAYAKYSKECLATATPPESCKTNPAPRDMEIAKTNVPVDNFNTYSRLNTPYEELFGDVVAALAADDLDVNSKSITKFIGKEWAIGRSFSMNEPDPTAGQDPYMVFSSIRKDIWDQWITPRLNDKPALLKELAEIFIDETLSNIETDGKIEYYEILQRTQILRLQERLNLKTSTGQEVQTAQSVVL